MHGSVAYRSGLKPLFLEMGSQDKRLEVDMLYFWLYLQMERLD